MILGGNELGADAPGVDLGALAFEVSNDVFLELVGGDDEGVFEPRVEDFAVGDLTELGEVAGIEAYGGTNLEAAFLHLAEDLDGIGHAAFDRVVGVDEKNGFFRI